MEVKNITTLPLSNEMLEKKEKEKKQREEASKSVGDFLISASNLCFDKCISTDSMYFSKKERKCVEEFFNKFTHAHQYTYDKFLNINLFTENASVFERSSDFGDYYGILESVFGEDLSKKDFTNKDQKFH